MSATGHGECDLSELIQLHALRALPADEAAAAEAHVETCSECRRELEVARAAVAALAGWPTDVLRPAVRLWDRVASRIAPDAPAARAPERRRRREPEWREVAPGISCKLLATDHGRRRVSMLVRLAPRTDYPPHRHAGREELHLLEGVLIVDQKTLHPGDYLRSEPGTGDARVYSETGCTCVLVTSIDDELG
jgi:anti-sigma factor ChrR (cupin superfamily)